LVTDRFKCDSARVSWLLRPGRSAQHYDQRVCLFVCLSARISRKPHVQISPSFLYILSVAVARSSSGGNAICYVLPVSWMTSFFIRMQGIGQDQGITQTDRMTDLRSSFCNSHFLFGYLKPRPHQQQCRSNVEAYVSNFRPVRQAAAGCEVCRVALHLVVSAQKGRMRP